MRRARGTGSVYQPRFKDRTTGKLRKGRLWWICYRVPGKDQAEREPTGKRSRAEAEQLLRTRLATLDAGEIVGPSVDRTTWKDLKAMIRADYKANGRRSESRLELSLKRLDESFRDELRASAITADRVTGHAAARLEAGAARASVNRELAALKRAFRLAARARRVAAIPYISALQERNARTGFFEREQFESLVGHLPADLQLVAQVAYTTGWRLPSEILTRQRRHLDVEAGWLRLEPGETKNGRGRQFPLPPALLAALRARAATTEALERAKRRVIPWLFHHEGDPLFYGDGKERHFQAAAYVRKSWRAACKAAGLPGRIPHDFRRTAVRNLERAGVSRSAAMALIGHETESVYRRYAIVGEADLKDAVAKLGRVGAGSA